MSEFISEAIGTEGENKSFENIMNNVNGNFNYLNEKIDSEINLVSDKIGTQILFGVYTGNGVAERFINLGFTPTAVEVYRYDGYQGYSSSRGFYFGGLAVNGYPCRVTESGKIIEIVENGFKIFHASTNNVGTNDNSTTFYFKVYKSGAIVEGS